VYGLNEVLAIYRNRKNSLSARKIDMLKYNYQIYRQVENFSPIMSVFFLFFIFLPCYVYKKFDRYLYQYSNIDKEAFSDICKSAKFIKENLTTGEGGRNNVCRCPVFKNDFNCTAIWEVERGRSCIAKYR
jgi:hypothetical protein